MYRIVGMSLLALSLLGEGARADAPAPIPGAVPAGDVLWHQEVTGYGGTRTEAEQRALERAADELAVHLLRQRPSLGWVPSAEELSRWGMVQKLGPSPTLEVVSPDVGAQYVARVRVELTEANLQDILAREAEKLTWARQVLSAKLLAALVGALAVLAGYFRLEELTRGYYTGVLRTLLAVCLGLLGAGLWLIL